MGFPSLQPDSFWWHANTGLLVLGLFGPAIVRSRWVELGIGPAIRPGGRDRPPQRPAFGERPGAEEDEAGPWPAGQPGRGRGAEPPWSVDRKSGPPDTATQASAGAQARPATRRRAIRVLIADDHAFMRGLIRGLLSPLNQMEVAGEAGDGQEAVALCDQLEPDVVIMDVAMPRLNGIDATSRIARDHPRTRVIALSMYAAPQYVLGMARAGAQGYVVKDFAFEELQPAIMAVTSGTPYVSERIPANTAQEFSQIARRRHDFEPGPQGPGPEP